LQNIFNVFKISLKILIDSINVSSSQPTMFAAFKYLTERPFFRVTENRRCR